MRQLFLVLLFTLSIAAIADAGKLDKNRSYLDRLIKKDSASFDDFELPYLTCATAQVFELSVEQTLQKLKESLKKGEWAVGSHYGSTPRSITASQLALPAESVSGKQLDGIKDCSPDYCLMKLQNGAEKKAMKASNQKLETYKTLIAKRINEYLSKQVLQGYEDRVSNTDAVKKMFEISGFVSARYPAAYKYFQQDFWKGNKSSAVRHSFIRQRMFSISADKLQPILRIGEVFDFSKDGAGFFVDLHVYSNHYFDSSLRFYEVMSVPNLAAGKPRTAVILTDIMEIDELKKSGLIRTLYKGQMVQAVAAAQEEELEKITEPL